jgi:hypothetical protein
VYIDIVTVADVPDDYDTRLETMDIEGLTRLRLKVFERHDLVLAKLCRNIDRDREDVVALARGPGLDIDVLQQRYQGELRPKLGRPEREDLTLRLWSARSTVFGNALAALCSSRRSGPSFTRFVNSRDRSATRPRQKLPRRNQAFSG